MKYQEQRIQVLVEIIKSLNQKSLVLWLKTQLNQSIELNYLIEQWKKSLD